MTTITTDQIDYIKKVIHACTVIGATDVKYENGTFSGLNEQQTAVVCQKTTKTFPFTQLGLIKLPLFTSRLTMFQARDNFELIPDTRADGTISSLLLKSKGAKVNFAVANAKQINAPKGISDVMKIAFELSKEDADLIKNAANIMPTSEDKEGGVICLMGKADGTITFQIVDQHDSFDGELNTSTISLTEDTDVAFCKRYPLKTLLNAIRNHSGLIKIGQKGMMNVVVDGISIYILPRA